jgi:hypothetical protein
MKSFAVFRHKVDALLITDTSDARAELFLLINFALSLVDGQNKQFLSFIERERHSKVFLDAYMAFCRKALQIRDVRDRMPIQERQAIVDRLGAVVRFDMEIWEMTEPKRKT